MRHTVPLFENYKQVVFFNTPRSQLKSFCYISYIHNMFELITIISYHNVSCHEIRKYSRSEIRTHHTAEKSPTSRKGVSCSRNSKKYISDVTFNYFFFRFSKSTENKSRLVKLSVKIQHRTIRKQLFLVL